MFIGKLPELEYVCEGGGTCVLVEEDNGGVRIRDSKNPDQEGSWFTLEEYWAFRSRLLEGKLTTAVALHTWMLKARILAVATELLRRMTKG